MEEKVTWMVLKADLHCPSCYKKVKKLLCKFPQIRDQVYDEKKNLVTITVVCCSPEKIRDKLCCKGRKVIHSIDILEPPKPKPPPPADKPKPPTEKPKDPPKPAEKPKDPPKPAEKPKDPPKPAEKPKDPPPAQPKEPVVLPPPPTPAPCPCPAGSYPVPVGFFGIPCYGIYGPCPCPCCNGYGRPAVPPPPPPPPPRYDNNYGGCGCGCGGGYNRACYASRCDYFSEENTSGCTTM